MATNWPQQVNPRACRSALCACTADWNSRRENNCNSCENILLTRVKVDPPSLKSVAKPDQNLSEDQPFLCQFSNRNLDKSDSRTRHNGTPRTTPNGLLWRPWSRVRLFTPQADTIALDYRPCRH